VSSARAVALSIVFPSDDLKLPAELSRLRRLLSNNVTLLIGGRVAEAYGAAFDSVNTIFVTNIGGFRRQLDQLRSENTPHRAQREKGD
jgi:MerR family transcriptional regulator, light-induced transcriptional regulator